MKKIIDAHGRVFGKVSIIDFIVILIAVAVCAALYVRFNVLEATSAAVKTEKIVYTVTIYGVRDYTADSLRAGDLLFDKNSGGGNTIGTIQDVSFTPAVRAGAKADGSIVLGSYENRYDVTLTVEADGTKDGGRYLVNKTYELNANSSRNFHTKYSGFEATITGIA